MFNDLVKYVAGAVIITILFSFLYKKGDIKSGNRVIRIVLVIVGSLFLVIFLFGIGLIIWDKNFKDYQNAILPLSIMLLTAILLFSVAIFKKDFSKEFKNSSLIKNKETNIAEKKTSVLLWILWVSAVIMVAVALKTYSMFFFISAGLLLAIIIMVRLKRGY